MNDNLPVDSNTQLVSNSFTQIPSLIRNAGPRAQTRFLEFFTAHIRNRGTRVAYGTAVARFCRWCEPLGVSLPQVSPIVVATFIEELTNSHSAPTVKLHLAAIRMLFEWLVIGQIIPVNPVASVRGPKHVVKKGRTPVLSAMEARQLIDSIDCSSVIGLRDRAIIAVMVYSFARVSATIGMNMEDYYPQGRRMWLRLLEKGGKHHEVPAHHNVEAYLDAYLSGVGDYPSRKVPLFRTVSRERQLTMRRLHRIDVLRMIKRRALRVGLPERICCHTFRATGITTYLENGGSIEHAQTIAGHESIRTTKLYDRTSDAVSLDEIERIII